MVSWLHWFCNSVVPCVQCLSETVNSVVPWFSGSVVLWFCVLRFCSFHGFCGSVVPWLCSFLVLCSLSFVVLWLHVFMVPWFCDSVVSAVQISMIPYSSSLQGQGFMVPAIISTGFKVPWFQISVSLVLTLINPWFYGWFL